MGFNVAANDNAVCGVGPAARVLVRQFSPCGPCLTKGELVRTTPRFVIFRERQGRERRLSCDTVHVDPCPSCQDHPQTQYPHGYTD